MAKYVQSWQTITAAALADTTNSVDSTYEFLLQGGTTTQRIVVTEIYIGGEDTASTVNTIVLARDSTTSGTSGQGGNKNAVMDSTATAPGTLALYGSTSSTKYQRAATLHLLQLSMNSFGGIVRWVAAPGNEVAIYGNAVNIGELSLSHVTGTGKTSGHVIYEIV